MLFHMLAVSKAVKRGAGNQIESAQGSQRGIKCSAIHCGKGGTRSFVASSNDGHTDIMMIILLMPVINSQVDNVIATADVNDDKGLRHSSQFQ